MHNTNIRKKIISIFILAIAAVLIIIISSLNISSGYTTITNTSYFFDTFVTLTIYERDKNHIDTDKEIMNECFNMCKKYEEIFSAALENSELYQLNASDSTTIAVSDELADILKTSAYYNTITEGAFNISVGKLSSLWNFKNNAVPSDTMLKEYLKEIKSSSYTIDNNSLIWNTLNDAPDITLGGIAKGYIADKLKEYLVSKGITSGIINLGGNVLLIGEKPDNSSFYIGITKPFTTTGETITSIALSDMSVVTSGIYERYFIENEKIYHHILNPDTGYPVENDLYSVTIISDSSTMADALSTSIFVMGKDKGLAFVNNTDKLYAIFVTDHYDMILSSGLILENNVIKIDD